MSAERTPDAGAENRDARVHHDASCASLRREQCDCSVTAHIRATPRTHGYVICWPRADCGYDYIGEKVGCAYAPENARIMPLSVASVVLKSAGTHAEIVRVRRVKGEDQWVPLTESELEGLGLLIGPNVFSLGNRDMIQGMLYRKRIPAVPRWEIDEVEDDNG